MQQHAKQHADPSRPLREQDAAESPKRQPRPAPDAEARRERMDYEREQLQRNRRVDEQLDHALVESFPASDPLAVTPEGTFPVRDPQLAPEARGEPGQATRSGEAGKAGEAPAPSTSRHAGRGPRHAQRRGDPQTPPQPTDPTPPEPLAPQVPGHPAAPRAGSGSDHEGEGEGTKGNPSQTSAER